MCKKPDEKEFRRQEPIVFKYVKRVGLAAIEYVYTLYHNSMTTTNFHKKKKPNAAATKTLKPLTYCACCLSYNAVRTISDWYLK